MLRRHQYRQRADVWRERQLCLHLAAFMIAALPLATAARPRHSVTQATKRDSDTGEYLKPFRSERQEPMSSSDTSIGIIPRADPGAEQCFDSRCQDDPQYRTVLGLSCADLLGLVKPDTNCFIFWLESGGQVKLTPFVSYRLEEEEVFKLAQACPCACNLDCGDTHAPTISPAPSASPSSSPSAAPTSTPSVSPTSSPSLRPSASPSSRPSAAPTSSPSSSPSASPSSSPSASPSAAPSSSPTAAPSSSPSAAPSASPTSNPSAAPSSIPTSIPSTLPTISAMPTPLPTISMSPTTSPTTVDFSMRSEISELEKAMGDNTAADGFPSSKTTALVVIGIAAAISAVLYAAVLHKRLKKYLSDDNVTIGTGDLATAGDDNNRNGHATVTSPRGKRTAASPTGISTSRTRSYASPPTSPRGGRKGQGHKRTGRSTRVLPTVDEAVGQSLSLTDGERDRGLSFESGSYTGTDSDYTGSCEESMNTDEEDNDYLAYMRWKKERESKKRKESSGDDKKNRHSSSRRDDNNERGSGSDKKHSSSRKDRDYDDIDIAEMDDEIVSLAGTKASTVSGKRFKIKATAGGYNMELGLPKVHKPDILQDFAAAASDVSEAGMFIASTAARVISPSVGSPRGRSKSFDPQVIDKSDSKSAVASVFDWFSGGDSDDRDNRGSNRRQGSGRPPDIPETDLETGSKAGGIPITSIQVPKSKSDVIAESQGKKWSGRKRR